MIRGIYETLNDLLSTDPNYLHQRAKCYIRSAFKTNDRKLKQEWLTKAQRDAALFIKFLKRDMKNVRMKKYKYQQHILYIL